MHPSRCRPALQAFVALDVEDRKAKGVLPDY
jgi:hypothetical protein